ncbi:MAG: hypothetical protein ACJAYE_001295 [Candidatus Azotimanducaceae bacterium]|jgi:hypothetical protein
MKHALYQHWQGEYEAAYRVAEHYRLRGFYSPELRLAQASASLELGYLAHGRELINDLDEGSLLPENQSRLHLYLARDAYRRRDWILLDEHLDALKPFEVDSRHHLFLLAESARERGRYTEAEATLRRLEKDDVYLFYGRFNLATSLVVESKIVESKIVESKQVTSRQEAKRLLLSVIRLPARDLEQLMLTERARVALADLYLDDSELDAARPLLSKISASHQYGPPALARLARLDMQAERYKNAAAIWDHLLQVYPWHRAATAAPSGLGYAMLQSRGEEAAYGTYLAALTKIERQQERLVIFREQLQQNLRDPNWLLGKGDSELSLLTWLAEGLGHSDWTSWLADESVRQSARHWQSLDAAYEQLQSRQQDLAILLAVDAEQQRRIKSARSAISEDELDQVTIALVQNIQNSLSDLRSHRYEITGHLEAFTTTEEQTLLDALRQLQASKLGEAETKRIERLIGLVRFQIYDAIPVRRQQQAERLEVRLNDARKAEQRIARINAAAEKLPQADSVSGRIQLLATDSESLRARTELALGLARDTLIASMSEFVGRDEALLAAQAGGLQYDITRLLDQQYVAAEAGP